MAGASLQTGSSRTWAVPVGDDETTAVWDPPETGELAGVYVCAHGAGGHMADRSVLAAAAALRQVGLGTVRFNFLYRARGSRRPDLMPVLVACLEAVLARVRVELGPELSRARLLVGGRSMGGRAASMLLADRPVADGLLLLAYPLHPPGRPDKLRAAHLARITHPVLCLNGTRDVFCDRPLMEQEVARLGPNWRMRWIEAADHSFHVLKRSGRTDAEVLDDVARETAAWMRAW